MTGPLTPPPSSAQEFRDAARASVPPLEVPLVAQATSQPEPAVTQEIPAATVLHSQNLYQKTFSAMSSYAVTGQCEELVRLAEECDLQPVDKAHPDHFLITVPLVLSYLVMDDPAPAKHALTRLSEYLSSWPISSALFRLVASASERRYQNIYVRAREVFEVLQNTHVPSGDLRSVAIPLLERYIHVFRQKTFALLSKAFTSVSVPLVEQYLGYSTEEVLGAANEYGWTFDAIRNILLPAPIIMNASGNVIPAKLGAQSTLATFRMIADIDLE